MILHANIFLCNLSLSAGIIKQLERIMRQCLWRGNSDTPEQSLAAWPLVCRPKENGGMGIINLSIQNTSSSFTIKLMFLGWAWFGTLITMGLCPMQLFYVVPIGGQMCSNLMRLSDCTLLSPLTWVTLLSSGMMLGLSWNHPPPSKIYS